MQRILKKKEITSHEAWEIFLLDLVKTVEWYDSSIEFTADYRSPNYIRPEDAFYNIANIKNTNSDNVWDVLEAKKLVKTRKKEDYQRRF